MLIAIRITGSCQRYGLSCFVLPIFLLLLSGCSVVPSFTGSNEEATAQHSETQDAPDLSPEEMLAKTLLETEDRYLLAKRIVPVEQTEQFENAIRLFNSGDFDAASATLAPLLTGNNVLSAMWVLNGDIALEADNTEQAVSDFHTALDANPYNYFALNRLGVLYREKGQFTTARSYYKQALSAWPGFASTYYNSGILHDLYLGEKQTAVTMYENYLALIAFNDTAAVPEKEIRKVKRWVAEAKRQLASTNDIREQ